MNQHLLSKLAPATARQAAGQFMTRVIMNSTEQGRGQATEWAGGTPGAYRHQRQHAELPLPAPTPAVLDLESLPREQRSLQRLVESLEPEAVTRMAPTAWYQKRSVIDLLNPAVTALQKIYPVPRHRAFCRILPTRDYREHQYLGALDGLSVGDVPELAEYPIMMDRAVSYTAESASLRTVGRILRVTRQTLTNDAECQFFAPAVQALVAAAYRREAADTYALLESGATLADGQPLWDSSNSVTGANVLSVFEKGFTAFAEAAFATGEPLDVDPVFMVIPSSWSLAASDIISDLLLNITSLRVIKSAHVTSGYLLADPAVQPVVGIMAMGAGMPSIELDNRPRKTFEGLSLKVSHSYRELALSRVGAVRMTITS